MLKIYAVSDSIGETSQQVANAIASQFSNDIEIIRVAYVKSNDDVNRLVDKIKEPENSLIVSTIVLVEVREFLVERCVEKGIQISNILGPSIGLVARMLNKMPEYKPGAIWDIDSEYFKKIEAMEFAMQFDDSKDYTGMKNADVVLIGLSRTSKTPLSMYLANKGIKVLNVPLVPEVPLPDQLFEIKRRKIFGLTIDPFELMEIRKKRLDKFVHISSDIQYANEARILEEFEFADNIMKRLGCMKIDVTKRAIEDTALIIMDNM